MPGFSINNKSSGPNSMAETVKSYRWDIEKLGPVSKSSVGRDHWYAKSITLPSFGTSVEEVIGSSVKYKFASFVDTGNTSIVLYNMSINGTTLLNLIEQWGKLVIGNNSSGIVLNKVNVADSYKYESAFVLQDESNNDITKVKLHNSWPSRISNSALDYTRSEISEVTIELICDWSSVSGAPTAASTPPSTPSTTPGRQ